MINYILSQIKLRFFRSLFVIFGIAIGSMLFIILSTLGNGFLKAASLPLEGVSADLIATRPLTSTDESVNDKARGIRLPFGLSTFTSTEMEEVKKLEGIESYAMTLQLWDFGGNNYRTIMGVNPEDSSIGPGQALRNDIIEGRTFQTGEHGVMVLDKHFAAFYNYNIGNKINLGNDEFNVIGIVELLNSNQTSAVNMYIPLSDAHKIAGLDSSSVNQVFLKAKNAGDVDKITANLSQKIKTISIISEDSLVQVMGGISKISTKFSKVAAIVGLLGGFLLGVMSLSGLINERRKEIGLMRALGWSKRDVLKIILLETSILSIFGGIIGVLLGMLGSWLIGQMPLPQLNQTLTNDAHGLIESVKAVKEVTLPTEINSFYLIIAFVSAIISGLLASWLGVRKVLSIKPTQILKG